MPTQADLERHLARLAAAVPGVRALAVLRGQEVAATPGTRPAALLRDAVSRLFLTAQDGSPSGHEAAVGEVVVGTRDGTVMALRREDLALVAVLERRAPHPGLTLYELRKALVAWTTGVPGCSS